MIEFKPVDQNEQTAAEPPPQTPAAEQYLPLVDQAEAEKYLFHFLKALSEGRLQVGPPLVMESAVLHAICAQPAPALREAMRNCLIRLLFDLSPDAGRWGEFALSPDIWGVALALYNSLTPVLVSGDGIDPVPAFTHALIDPLRPARDLLTNLSYHAVLRHAAERLSDLPKPRAEAMDRLIRLCPLSGLCHLDQHAPPALTPLAADLLPGRRRRAADPSPWVSPEDWLDAVFPLMDHPVIASHIRQRWLRFPENRAAFRNRGLFLEALRRQGDHRDFILTFYEAYDYAFGENIENTWGGTYRHWPILDRIDHLLHVGGDSEKILDAALRLNQSGQEYFLFFYPLTQIIREGGARVPAAYNHLHPGWIPALMPMLDHINERPRFTLDQSGVEFVGTKEDEDKRR